MGKFLYLSYDGDGCGKKVGRAIIANDENALREISAKIDLGQEIANHWAAKNGGKKISSGGDEGSVKLPEEALDDVEQFRKDYHFATGITISVGVGKSLSEAGRSLLAAKFRGKDQIAIYDESVEKDIDAARKRVKKGKASQEEYKLAEAYLEKAENKMDDNSQSCPYCDQTDGTDPDHCKYCHDAEVAEGHEECPYCNESATGSSSDCPYCKENPSDADKCPYCKDDAASGPKQPEVAEQDNHGSIQAQGQHIDEQTAHGKSPDSNNASAPAGSPEEQEQANSMGMNPPAHGKPEIGNNSSPQGEGQANPMDSGSALPQEQVAATGGPSEAAQQIPSDDDHSREAMQAIVETIEGQNSSGQPDKAMANEIDDTNLAVDNETEENVSRPPGYEENTPRDMGLAEDETGEEGPDLNSVLQEGLDNHAQNITKEKVIQLVGTALEDFKGCKDILEKAKEQAPQLYKASIGMLSAMIEMAKMLGLGGEEGDSENAPEAGSGETPEKEHDWHEPFPKHPDKGGEEKPGHAAPKEGAAEAPKGSAPVGQPIGKLSAKHTTKHVARTTMPPGAMNAKGQQKIIDPKTGKTRWIDRKKGMVQSPTGVPIRPPKQGGNAQN